MNDLTPASKMPSGLRLFLLMLVLSGCIDPYQTNVLNKDSHLLVIDAFVNATDHLATVKLRYSTPASTSEASSPERLATVSVEDQDNGESFVLPETGSGIYQLANVFPGSGHKFRLHILTIGGREYQSDDVQFTTSPPIDSVVWRAGAGGINIQVSTHGTPDDSRYYFYWYEETWEHQASFYSYYKIVNEQPVLRNPDEFIFTCWTTAPSTGILTTNTLKLSENIISNFQLHYVSASTPQLWRRYSINVHQRAILPDEYEYQSGLKKTTESLGGLFDPQPEKVVGNIHSITDSKEQVLGFFSGGEVRNRRIFILFNDLPGELLRLKKPQACDPLLDILRVAPDRLSDLSKNSILIDGIYDSGLGRIVAYTFANKSCIDCREDGGTNVRPDFW
jgi:Domain of unknown function (DUF4249)